MGQSSLQGGGQASSGSVRDSDRFCRQEGHGKTTGGGKLVTSHLCVEEQALICGRCAQKHMTRGHTILPLNLVVNKTRSVLRLLQDQADALLAENNRNLETCRFKQEQMQRAQGAFEERLGKTLNETVKRVHEQRDAASAAHLATLKLAYGDLDADVRELNAWSRKKHETKSELDRLNGLFGKYHQCNLTWVIQSSKRYLTWPCGQTKLGSSITRYPR